MLLDSGCVICAQVPGPVCSACADHLLLGGSSEVAGLVSCRAAVELDDHARTIIAALKYRGQRRVAGWLGRLVAPLVPRAADALTWVPATPERRRQRGFDQAEQLARSLSQQTGVPTLRLLERASNDTRQTGQSREQRQVGPNVRGVRSCPPFVVLIDDVVTTGSSLRVAAAALRAQGGCRIIGVTAAITPANRDRLLHGAVSGSSICKWT